MFGYFERFQCAWNAASVKSQNSIGFKSYCNFNFYNLVNLQASKTKYTMDPRIYFLIKTNK